MASTQDPRRLPRFMKLFYASILFFCLSDVFFMEWTKSGLAGLWLMTLQAAILLLWAAIKVAHEKKE